MLLLFVVCLACASVGLVCSVVSFVPTTGCITHIRQVADRTGVMICNGDVFRDKNDEVFWVLWYSYLRKLFSVLMSVCLIVCPGIRSSVCGGLNPATATRKGSHWTPRDSTTEVLRYDCLLPCWLLLSLLRLLFSVHTKITASFWLCATDISLVTVVCVAVGYRQCL